MKNSLLALTFSLSLFQTLSAADFTIKDGETVNTQQVLSDKGDKGKIEEGGTLSTGASTAVLMQNDNQKLKNSGDISTSGNFTNGIDSLGADTKIKNSGSITTSGVEAIGILSQGIDAEIKNKGNITTNANNSAGISCLGKNANIKNSGEISTDGSNSWGIRAREMNAWIINSGSITTNGSNAHGLLSQSVDSKIYNKGDISTNGITSDGILSIGADSKIKNKGNISTSEFGSNGIHSQGTHAKIENSGMIMTSEISAYGIYSERSGAKIKNNGDILTSGNGSFGIISLETGDKIKNNGNISTSGLEAIGIYSGGANARIKNKGNISTTGDSGHGILCQSADSRIKNKGNISTNAIFSFGILSQGADVKIENSGDISTRGDDADGILSQGADAWIENKGDISTSGDDAHGIHSQGVDARIENKGDITTSGENARGIFGRAADAKIDNSGDILTSGINADGIFSIASNLQLTNSGTIKSEQAFAINSTASNPTLTLKRGSNIQGGVNSENPLNLYVKKGLNLDLTVEGAGFGAIGIDDPYVIDGLNVVVVDRSGFALQADFLADLSDTVLGGVAHSCVNGCCIDPCRQGFWLAGIGSYRERSSKDRIVGIRNEQAGILFGYNTSLCDGNAGAFGSIMYGNPEVSRHTQHAETKSYIGGVNYNKAYCGTCYGVSVAGGYVDWENRRHVMNNLVVGGEETGKANLDGGFVSAEVSLTEQACCLPCSPMMSVSLRYAGLYFGDYKEKGIAAPLSVKGRDIDLLTTRVEFAFTENSFHTYSLCVEPYFGFYGRYQFQGKRVDGELLDEELTFTQGNHHSLAAVIFGLRATRECCSNTLFINLETDFDNQRSSRFIGEIGVHF